ncbi:DNA replication and repair protein RecO [Alteribacillus persepolensis]|uniref:DNA repair protein RecO n=1 Tax=Alteribacillus persepolensis TaxID=568899 RepID=A0A1G8CRY9_9BACI|nr:DNA repair protein RecO [Alteribacillus persepolensis]SDH48043.1 DNA replication and repair protein RecO [Alteribacillus persepolensis]
MLEKAEGIVLRTIAYGENNVILRIYTREAGKISVMARGAKKPKNKLSAAAQPFVYGMFLYYKGSGMSTLSQGDNIDSFRIIRDDIVKTAYASYMSELLDKLTDEKERNPYLFELFLQLLQKMNEDDDPEVLTRIFETKMMQQAGITPELNQCVRCKRKEGTFSFSVKEAGFLCHHCKGIDEYRFDIHQKTVQLLRTFFYMDMKRLGNVALKQSTKTELRQVLQTYYDEYTGIFLKSRRFLEQMENWSMKTDDKP